MSEGPIFQRVALIGLGLIILALQLIVHAAEPITEARGMQVLFSSLAGDTLLAVLVILLAPIVARLFR